MFEFSNIQQNKQLLKIKFLDQKIKRSEIDHVKF